MSEYRVRFNRPTLVGNELTYVTDAIQRGRLAGDNLYSQRCHRFLEQLLGVPKALLTTSCTDALEMAALLLDVQPGDEVIVPAFTFVSTVNAFVLRGARPVFIDIRPDTLNLDETQLERLITPRTRVIAPVHYAGVGCEMDAITAIARQRGLAVVEDNAHGLFGKYRGRYLGTFGDLATLSFHETKNLTCGEGGALLINNERYVERAEIVREKGTDRSRFFRGQVDKYSWVDLGSSYLLADILAAFLWAQMEAYEEIQAKRRRIWQYYDDQLRPLALEHGIRQPTTPSECEQPYHIYYLLLRSLQERQALIEHLKGQGILSVFHYLPLHLSVMGRRFGGKEGDCPVTEQVSDTLVRLPFYADLTQEEQDLVVTAIRSFYENNSAGFDKDSTS
jgi:dTDP-4-amino-4,6-dideoxygalactose transaminase